MIPWALVQDFANRLNLAWEYAGRPRVRVTSWYRDRDTNERVGGAAQSQHLLALAIDVAHDSAGLAVARAAQSVGLTMLDEGDHYHIQYARAGTLPASLWV